MSIIFDIELFKQKFARNFPFLPYYNEEMTYKKDSIVYDKVSDVFYKSLIDNNTQPLDDSESWKVYTDVTKEEYVADEDIGFAELEAREGKNEEILTDLSYMYLVAFYLCYDLDLATSEASGQVGFVATSKKVGSVSETYMVPQWVEQDPYLSFFARNGFGLKFLSLIRPKLVGNTDVVAGWTLPA